MKKLSVIRGGTISSCPYGLPIISACKDVGGVILQMQALSQVETSDEKQVAQKNKVIYLTQKIGERCIFANEIMEKFDKVDCSYGDSAAGEGTAYLTPSPLYPRTFIGDGINPGPASKGQDVYDPRLYFEAPERGIDVPFGLYSIFADKINEDGLLRVADKYTNKIINIKDKLAFLRKNYLDILKTVIPNSSVVKLSEKQLEELLFAIDSWTKL